MKRLRFHQITCERLQLEDEQLFLHRSALDNGDGGSCGGGGMDGIGCKGRGGGGSGGLGGCSLVGSSSRQ